MLKYCNSLGKFLWPKQSSHCLLQFILQSVEWSWGDKAVSFRHETFLEGANDNNASVPQKEMS